MTLSNLKWIGGIVVFIIWTIFIGKLALDYQYNKDDLKTKDAIIKKQIAQISLLKADKELKAEVLVQIESFALDLNEELIKKNRKLNYALRQIDVYKKNLNDNNVITTNFMQLATGAYPYFAGMPFNSASVSGAESAGRIVPSDAAMYIRERTDLGERYRIYFIACRDQYNYIMKKNNDFVMSMDK